MIPLLTQRFSNSSASFSLLYAPNLLYTHTWCFVPGCFLTLCLLPGSPDPIHSLTSLHFLGAFTPSLGPNLHLFPPESPFRPFPAGLMCLWGPSSPHWKLLADWGHAYLTNAFQCSTESGRDCQ